MKILPAIFSMLTLGCARQSPYTTEYNVYIDPAFTDPSSVMDALESWEMATNVVFLPALENRACSDTDFGCISIHPTTSDVLDADEHRDQTLGMTVWHRDITGHNSYSGWANVYVTDDFDQQTILHELGHSLGLNHTGDGTLMCAYTTCAAEAITPADIAQYADLR
jgi:hypothetical protein